MANHLSFDLLTRLVESRGSTADDPRARRHLASCARCRSELEWLQRIQGGPGCAGRSDVDSDDDLEASVRLRY